MIKTLKFVVIPLSVMLMTCVATAGQSKQLTAIKAEHGTPSVDNEQAEKTALVEQNLAIQRYQQLVDKLESSGGVYQVQLSEVLSGLGDSYQALGRHADAVAAYQRSLHISRVNDGLYSLNQVPILEKMIASNSKLRDWKSLDNNYHNLYWISKRHYGENSPELLPLIDRIGRWHLKAYELAPKEESFAHLVIAEQLYNKAVDIIEAENGQEDIRLLNPLYGIVLTNHQIAVVVSSATDFDDVRSGFRDANQRSRLLQAEQARQDLILQSYVKGKNAMKRIVDIYTNNPVLPVDAQAMALAYLGDWYLLFNKRNSAAATYDQAYQLLLEAGVEEKKIDVLFGQPRTLPAIRLPMQSEADISPENSAYVLASFDVSPSGRAQNIEIIESSPSADVSYQRRARRSIASTKFRPRYENGKPVETTGVSLRYVFTD